MKSLLPFLLLLSNLLFADENYSVRIAHGTASQNDLGQIISGELGSHYDHLSVTAVDAGYLYAKDLFDFPIDVYLKGGLSYFNEQTHDNVLEGVVYIKLFYNINFLSSHLRFGFGEGGSYVSSVLDAEHLDAQANRENNENGNTSNFLNYLDISFDFDVGKLVRYKPLEELYLGVLLKHRSGIFGLINNVAHGGSNYNSIYIEKNF